jgi:DNA-binding response OmpR family regulator
LKFTLPNEYDVTCSGDEATTLKSITPENIPDVMIIEETISAADGYEIRQLLKQVGITKFIPIVFLVDKPPPEKFIEPDLRERDNFVTKPFDVEELKLRVQNVIRWSRRNG